MSELFDSGEAVEYDGPVDGERRKVKVRVMGLSLETGVAYFEGSGEAY